MYVAKPTERQLEWYDREFGVLIHYFPYRDGKQILLGREALAAYDPPALDPEQWIRTAWKAGAKYAVLVAKQCAFAAWPTKENDCSVASTRYKDGKGDVVREFIDACAKYGLRPGLYYHTTRFDYYGINNEVTYDYKGAAYQEYVRHVENQLKELMTEYGEIAELWFDGGLIPVRDGGPDVLSLLRRYQPNCITFQGPPEWEHNVRWVGNEEGLAPETCWSTTNAGEARYDGTEAAEEAGVGDPDGKYFWPAETDVPNRTRAAEGGGWGWAPGQEDLIFPPETLLRFYLQSVGRNSNRLVGMAIDADGQFEDEEQFVRFGELLRSHFGTPLVRIDSPAPENGAVTLRVPASAAARYLVVREDITDGQHLRSYSVSVDGAVVRRGSCVGHKCIVPLEAAGGAAVTFRAEDSAGPWKLRDIALY